MGNVVDRLRDDWESHQKDGGENDTPGKPWGWQWAGGKIVSQVMALVGDRLRGRVLEIGCGGGKWTKALCDIASHVCAIDVHETAIKESSEYEPRAEYKLSDGESIPYKKNSFEAVFSWDVFLHLPMPLVLQYLIESRRVARSVIFALPDPNTVRGKYMLRESLRSKPWRDPFRYGYMTYYVPEQVLSLMSLAGWGKVTAGQYAGVPEKRDMIYIGERQ